MREIREIRVINLNLAPRRLWICIEPKASLLVGQKVWEMSDNNFYIAEDVWFKGVYEIRLGSKIGFDYYKDVLRGIVVSENLQEYMNETGA